MLGVAHLRAAACLCVLVVGCTSARPHASTPADPTEHAPASSIDFARLRTNYGDRQDFADLCEKDRPLRQFVELTNAQRFQEVLAISQPWIAKCPVDIDAQFVTAVALSEMGRKEEADEHLLWFRGLVESVLTSGDGKSPESAFVVISVAEEYAVLRALNLRMKSQSLTKGHVDALTVEGERGETVIFFNPAAHFRRLERTLGSFQ